MPKAAARRATARPQFPTPTIPSVSSERDRNCGFCQRPSCMSAFIRGELADGQQRVAENRVGDGLAERVRRVADRDAAPPRLVDVDRVHAGAPLRDDAQIRRRVQHAAGDAIVAADDAVRAGQQPQEVVLFEPLGGTRKDDVAATLLERPAVPVDAGAGVWRGDDDSPPGNVGHEHTSKPADLPTCGHTADHSASAGTHERDRRAYRRCTSRGRSGPCERRSRARARAACRSTPPARAASVPAPQTSPETPAGTG